jgi:hypothetical protein
VPAAAAAAAAAAAMASSGGGGGGAFLSLQRCRSNIVAAAAKGREGIDIVVPFYRVAIPRLEIPTNTWNCT